jgi:glycosyltransferase involved in cell wall biosynthesis
MARKLPSSNQMPPVLAKNPLEVSTNAHSASTPVDKGRILLNVAAVIPAFEPDSRLVHLVEELSGSPIAAIVVVNDGSGPQYAHHFELIQRASRVHLVEHARNLGKGAALKSGFDYALRAFPDHLGVVTADADGQHHSEDILKVAQGFCSDPSALTLGVRTFGNAVPLRSRIGNRLTRSLVCVMTGQSVTDTQTGLRAIPRSLLDPLLRVPANGYEFETQMLISSQGSDHPIREVRIRTIYIDGNKSSHFNPILDSLRIYFTLFRFSISSILSALLDNVVFFLALKASFGLGLSQIAGRLASVALNYSLGRRAVFLSRQRHRTAFPKYLLLVIVSGIASYALIRLLTSRYSLGAVPAKMIAESILFIFNFFV